MSVDLALFDCLDSYLYHSFLADKGFDLAESALPKGDLRVLIVLGNVFLATQVVSRGLL